MTVIEFAEKRLNDVNNEEYETAYWAAYLDGARAQEKEYTDSMKYQTEWIKCSERLPYDDQMVLVPIITKEIPDTEILICRYIKCERPMFRHYGFRGIKDFTEVTHWMPLPDAPEVGG